METNLLPYAAALLAASGFCLAFALPTVNLLKTRISDFIAGMCVSISLGAAVIAIFSTDEVGASTFLGCLFAVLFGFVLATLVRTVQTFTKE
jgi:hypothetical protein